MTTTNVSAHRAAGEALAPEKESAGMSRPGSEAVQQRGLLNFKATARDVRMILRKLKAEIIPQHYEGLNPDVAWTWQADDDLVLFHTTTPEAARSILTEGFADRVSLTGFGATPREAGVWFGFTPMLPWSLDFTKEGFDDGAVVLALLLPRSRWHEVEIGWHPTWPAPETRFLARDIRHLPILVMGEAEVLQLRHPKVQQWFADAKADYGAAIVPPGKEVTQ